MMNRRHTLLGFATAALMALAPVAQPAEPLSVVATTGMIADAVRQVGGDEVSVKALMGPGVDPHAYRQTRSDIVAMTRADLVLWHGLYLEAQMEDFFHDLERKRDVVAVAEALPKDALRTHDDYADKYDPHVWMDPEAVATGCGLGAGCPDRGPPRGGRMSLPPMPPPIWPELDQAWRPMASSVLEQVPEEQTACWSPPMMPLAISGRAMGSRSWAFRAFPPSPKPV